MKITDIHQQSNTTQNVKQTNSAVPPEQPLAPQQPSDQGSSGDKVELSIQSKEMQKIYDLLQMTPDVRAEKVEALRKRIEEGKYQVDPDRVADKMIKESLMDLIR